jgi:hypothetical protein
MLGPGEWCKTIHESWNTACALSKQDTKINILFVPYKTEVGPYQRYVASEDWKMVWTTGQPYFFFLDRVVGSLPV